MSKIRRKTDHCLNCNYQFKLEENYCPVCGQENNYKIQPLRNILRDFVDDITQIDTRLIRSTLPFLFFPGKLTNEYIKGKRVYYVTPIRLYLVFSFLYFFVFSFLLLNNTGLRNQDKPNKSLLIQEQVSNPKKIRIADSATLALYQNMLDTKLFEDKDSLDLVKEIKELKLKQQLSDDSLVKYTNKKRNQGKINDIPINKILELSKIDSLTEDQMMDSLKIEKSFWNRMTIRQTIRISNSTPRQVISSVVEKVPIMMFFLLPVFAFMLKILYIRSKRLYVEHMIFTLHIHSFFFFIFALALVLVYLVPDSSIEMIVIASLISILYGFLSFHNVYKQNILKALVKSSILFFCYFIIISIALILEITISLVIF